MKKIRTMAISFIILILLLLFWRLDRVNQKLNREKEAHEHTKLELSIAIEKGLGWNLAYEKVLNDSLSQSKATQACLERETEALNAQIERKVILKNAQPRQLTDIEKKEVVDDATRMRIAARLNAPL